MKAITQEESNDLPEIPKRKQAKRKVVVKSKFLIKLKDLHYKDWKLKHPTLPEIVYSYKGETGTPANKLEKQIVEFLKLSGHTGERIKNMGRQIDGTKIVTNHMGQTQLIGSSTWIPGTGKNGTPDVHSEIKINGIPIAVKWEVKIGKDTQRKDQKKYEESVTNYFIIKTFDDFYEKYLYVVDKYTKLLSKL